MAQKYRLPLSLMIVRDSVLKSPTSLSWEVFNTLLLTVAGTLRAIFSVFSGHLRNRASQYPEVAADLLRDPKDQYRQTILL